MSLAGALRGTWSPSSVGARVITEEQWMTIMSKGLSRTETRWGQRCALVQETNSCLIICNWRRKKKEKSGCERRWWGGGAGTCLGVLPGFITFRPLCFSPSLSLKPRSLSMNWPAIAHIVCWKIILWCSSVNFGVLGCTWVCKKITGSKQELLSLGECFVAAPYQSMPCWSICLMLVKKMTAMTRHSKTMDEGSVAAYFTRGSWSSTSSIRAAALKLSSTKGELGWKFRWAGFSQIGQSHIFSPFVAASRSDQARNARHLFHVFTP